MIWIAFTATPQLEFSVAEAIAKLGAEKTIVPSHQARIVKNGKARSVRRPLAPGYVFAAFHGFEALHAAWHALKLVKGLRGAVNFDANSERRYSLLTPMDVRALYEMRAAEVEETSKHRPGDRVLIRNKLMMGIVERMARGKVIAIVDMFGKSHTVTVSEDQVEAA